MLNQVQWLVEKWHFRIGCGKNVIINELGFCINRNPINNHSKTCLVVKGFHQLSDLHYIVNTLISFSRPRLGVDKKTVWIYIKSGKMYGSTDTFIPFFIYAHVIFWDSLKLFRTAHYILLKRTNNKNISDTKYLRLQTLTINLKTLRWKLLYLK